MIDTVHDMVERLLGETKLSLDEAARMIPATNDRNHPSRDAIIRWITRGKRGVKLEGVRGGHGYWTTREAVVRFLVALTRTGLALDAAERIKVEEDLAKQRKANAAKAIARIRELRAMPWTGRR